MLEGGAAHVGLEGVYDFVKLGSAATRAVHSLFDAGIQGLILTPGSTREMVSLIQKTEQSGNIRLACLRAKTD